jgi:hypothetical protein
MSHENRRCHGRLFFARAIVGSNFSLGKRPHPRRKRNEMCPNPQASG